MDSINEIKFSDKTPLLSILLDGNQGSGKTALSAKLAQESGFSYAKFIQPSDFVGMPEAMKVAEIVKVFEDAYKSELSLIIIDDIETIIGYVKLNQQYSKAVVDALRVKIRQPPTKDGRKLMIIGTIDIDYDRYAMEELPIVNSFNMKKRLNKLSKALEFRAVLMTKMNDAEKAQQISMELES